MLIKNLGLINSLWSLILPAAVSVFNLLVIKSYYESLPEALEDSAKMDGARTFTILFRIILPLSGPVLATIALFYAVYYWNDFFHPMLYISDPSLKPLQLYLRDIVMDADSSTALNKSADDMMNVSPEGMRSATVIASTVPILLVYPFLQKYFIKGVLIGSVKG
ncbi:carbohydrate ABC transporter permease [Paenibacillus sp. P26]|nr:carbohydrate ABC transporter permease [Paenibacillus sp. P26]UUZ92980.1 carbohydrate ABC transporter permease [Paenibacillus sp. P25]